MMKCRLFLALAGLICSSAFAVDVQAGQALAVEPTLSAEAKKSVKHTVQAVVRPDGWVVDRLVGLNPVKSPTVSKKEPQGGLPATPEAWLARMLDPTKNGLVVKHPEYLAEWLDAVSEPRFMTALASVAMKPEAYANTLGKMADPATVRNWAELADPQVYLRWMAVGIDPGFYQSVFNRMTDIEKLRRWGLYPATPPIVDKTADNGAGLPPDPGWLQLQTRSIKTNPWLQNSVNYRY